MKTISTLNDMRKHVVLNGKRLRIAVVRANDDATREALQQVEHEHLADIIYIEESEPEVAATKAVYMVRNGEADVLMKGLIGTDQLLRAILDKQKGLLPIGHVLTHLAVAEIPTYRKLLFFTDAAVIPYPTLEQRSEQVGYAATVCHKMGIDEPRIALIHCSEKTGKQFPFVKDYYIIKERAKEGEFGNCIVDGPLDVKTACSLHALQAKGLESTLYGDADVLVMPDIEAGNTFYKSMTLFAHTHTAGILCGASNPVVIPSRGDDAESKYNSILFALATL